MAPQGRLDREFQHASGVVRLVVPVLSVCAVAAAVATDPGSIPALVALTAAAAALVVWSWRRYPKVLVVALVLLLTGASQLGGELEPGLFLLVLTAVALTSWYDLDRRTALLLATLLVGPVVIQAVQGANHVESSIWVLGIAMTATLGWSLRRHDHLSGRLARLQEELAEQTVLAERRRIAREVHDVVGHAMTGMMLHVTGARHQLEHDDAAAADSLAAAEEIGRAGVRELRSALGRMSEDDAGRTAAPGVADLTDLVAATRRRGLDVALSCSGVHDSVDPMLGLTLYRVTQESLTNAIRYAPDARTEVELAVQDGSVRLCITSTGPIRVVPDDDHRVRLGLEGMRERARVIGADFDAGPTDEGWRVRLRAPRRSAPTNLRGEP